MRKAAAKRGERLRVELLTAAAELVTETGDVSALSLRAIAARVGVAATSVYLQFPDITAVKIALAQQWFAEFADVRDAADADIADPAEALVMRCQTYAHSALAHPGPYRLMFGLGRGHMAGRGPVGPPGAGGDEVGGGSVLTGIGRSLDPGPASFAAAAVAMAVRSAWSTRAALRPSGKCS